MEVIAKNTTHGYPCLFLVWFALKNTNESIAQEKNTDARIPTWQIGGSLSLRLLSWGQIEIALLKI